MRYAVAADKFCELKKISNIKACASVYQIFPHITTLKYAAPLKCHSEKQKVELLFIQIPCVSSSPVSNLQKTLIFEALAMPNKLV